MSIALEVRDLEVEVGGRTVVHDLSFDLRAGEKMGVVGRNGAGKTSTLRVLAGELPAAAGHVIRRGAVGYLRQVHSPARGGGRGHGPRAHPGLPGHGGSGPPAGDGADRPGGIATMR